MTRLLSKAAVQRKCDEAIAGGPTLACPACPAALPSHESIITSPGRSQPEVMAGGIEFIYWLAKVGKSRPTGFRWRRKGMVETVNIEGKLFVEDAEIARFWKRAKNGEFAKKPCGDAARKKKKTRS